MGWDKGKAKRRAERKTKRKTKRKTERKTERTAEMKAGRKAERVKKRFQCMEDEGKGRRKNGYEVMKTMRKTGSKKEAKKEEKKTEAIISVSVFCPITSVTQLSLQTMWIQIKAALKQVEPQKRA